jgi:hypothetical protein
MPMGKGVGGLPMRTTSILMEAARFTARAAARSASCRQ